MSSPLIDYALRGLRSCWMPEHQAFSQAFLPEQPEPNVSIPESDAYYTLNVLLGLSRLGDKSALPWNLERVFQAHCERLPDLAVPTYAYGMALWAAAELQQDLCDRTLRSIKRLLDDRPAWIGWSAQDLGLMLSGVVAWAAASGPPWESHAHALMEHLRRHHDGAPSRLFYESPNRFRRRFASFATGTYLTLACFHYGERFDNQRAIDRALGCVRALRERQGPHGEWPWFWDVASGRVLDPYPVYSVHQDGMAPAFLHHAARHGDTEARESIRRGFEWILGHNELGRSMLLPRHGVILRSQERAAGRQRRRRAVRALVNWATRRSAKLLGPGGASVRRECRSYHLGWVVWSFAGRDDYRELTHHDAFRRAPRPAKPGVPSDP